ncbi:MAG: PAS domain-containing protein, partial [Burkholderiales bacterium]|nr:PAS domain-containing protein [Burkholderiales bacterium]
MDESFLAGVIVDHTPHALVAVDREGLVRFWNAGATTLYGHEAIDALGRRWIDLFGDPPPEGPAATAEVVRRCRNGALIYVQSCHRWLPGNSDLAAGLLFSDVDVTPLRVQREAQLVEERYGRLLESMPDAIVVADPIGRIVHVNAQAQQIFGYRSAALLGDVIERLLPARTRAAHVGLRDAYLASPRTRPMGQGLA